MAVHIIAEFIGVDPTLIKKARSMKKVLDRIVKVSGLNAISSCYHQFKPFGVSCVYLLKESHLSVHTWPECGYMALDIFSCGKKEKTLKAFELLKKEFSPKKVKKRILIRDYYRKLKKSDNR
jgi:S-adenosylmethionine decarboxylase